jgi:hypothetical protein
MTSLDLALIGNGSIGALIDAEARVAWCCFPRFDGDPVFCSLLDGEPRPEKPDRPGTFTIELIGVSRSEQQYLQDTPILVTRLYDAKGGGVEITDFCPRFEDQGVMVSPAMLIRQVRPIGGKPKIVVRVKPAAQYGCLERDHAIGANHISYSGEQALRLTTDAPAEAIVQATPFHLHQTVTMMFGNTDEIGSEVTSTGTQFLELGARLEVSRDLARSGNQGRDHAGAECVRGHGRDHRIDHHFDPGGAQHRENVGLPLLLAARCVLRRQRAGTIGRDSHDGAIPRLSPEDGGCDGRLAARPYVHD